jgi:hypothetical protein
MTSVEESTQYRLERELKRLSFLMGRGNHLTVRWCPKSDSELEGEVLGDTIFVYSPEKQRAIRTLQHEFIDWLVVEAIKPYEEMVNLHRTLLNGLFRHLQETAYSKKEGVVESLCNLLRTPAQQDAIAWNNPRGEI